ncbi:cadherin-like domain-containing protein [Rhizobium sp. BK251]|uniref:cadherin-like domain-containing protein n=1 Tax=Rhizobium sp. BK251 TaxID=2512125 RepID=UPI00104B3A74|nr:cadherin-like domain-containing protein [Rhizobium sp. BK251]TCL68198.1 Ca2+-binding RTX toxin-like protein [Rhizobium sp. BK251]
MDKKLVLGLPDAQAAIAPMNKYEIAEKKDGRKKMLLFPAFLFGAIGAVFSKGQPDAPHAQEQPAVEPETAAPVEEVKSDVGVIEDVAAFIREMAAESVTTEIEPERTRNIASVRVGFADSGSFSANARTFRAGSANDNDFGVVDRTENFEFPPLPTPGKARRTADIDAPSIPGLPMEDDAAIPGGYFGTPPSDDEDDNNPAARPNRLPFSFGRNVLADGLMNLSVVIMLDDLLAMARDLDGDQLSIRNLTVSSGSIRAYGDDAWIYTPERGHLGQVTFSYGISDGQGAVASQAVLNLRKHPPRELSGTDGDDTLLGTPQDDIITGLGGDDLIYGREANDILAGGDGGDRLLGGDGDDVLYGDGGRDHLSGGRGNDVLFGGDGDDRLFGDEGDDVLVAGLGDDILHGGSGNDRLFGDEGRDTLFGEAGNDLLDGGDGNDVLTGGGGNDAVLGGTGDDVMKAGRGGEEERSGSTTASDGDDVYSGGEGFDILDASAAQESVTIDLAAGTAEGEDIGSDRLDGIEGAIGGSQDDVLTGDAEDNMLDGQSGNDELAGGDGDDTISGGAGDDVVIVVARHVAGNDHEDNDDCDDNDGDDVYSGGDGFDTLDLTALMQEVLADLEQELAAGDEIGFDRLHGFEAVLGGSDDDRLSGNSQANLLVGGGGDDRLSGRGGDDVLIGGSGDDVVSGDAGDDTVIVAVFSDGDGADDGDDSYRGGEGCDTYDASGAMQAVVIDLERGTATGCNVGADTLESFEAAIGGSSGDTIIANGAVNFLAGGEGGDVFVFRNLASLANDGNGRDEIRDFGVGDRIDFSDLASEVGGLVFRSLMEEVENGGHVRRVTFYHQTFDDGERTVVKAIVDLDRDEDIEILLYGRHELTEQDFILAAREAAADDAVGRG